MRIVIAAALLAAATCAGAHPGGLDASGGHYNRKTGEYHSHRATGSSSTRATPRRTPTAPRATYQPHAPVYSAGSSATWQTPVAQPAPRPNAANAVTSTVCVRVVDGDTIVLASGETVRLIGVDTPETVDPRKPVQHFGAEASAFTKRVAEGTTITLEFDQQRTDRYGRYLAYVYLPDGLCLNELIIIQGFGTAYTNYPFRYMEHFRACERYAREQGRGLWATAPTVNTTPVPIATPQF